MAFTLTLTFVRFSFPEGEKGELPQYNVKGLKKEISRQVLRTFKKVGKAEERVKKAETKLKELEDNKSEAYFQATHFLVTVGWTASHAPEQSPDIVTKQPGPFPMHHRLYRFPYTIRPDFPVCFHLRR